MKTAQVGRRLGISSSTIYNYTVEPLYADFISEDARRAGGRQQANFNEEDMIVIWTIYRLRKKMSPEDVAIQLREGYRSKDMPMDGAGAIDKAAENIKALGIIPEYNRALERVTELEEDVDRLRELRIKDAEEIGRLRGQIEVLKQSLAEGDNAQEVGRLKGELEFLKRALPAEIKKLLGLE
jgi:hypothetical protein